ncbi:MAG: glycosyl hydrolase family 8 [Pseudomonadota bacterium]
MIQSARLFQAGALAAAMVLPAPSGAGPSPELVRPEEWRAYAEAFLEPSGRIVDTGNGGISHSEGQGYGMLLAYLASMQADFERIWSFTQAELKVRDDGLVAWKWDPGAEPPVTDINNASDGEILIAYALALAGADWGRPDYLEIASQMTTALGDAVLDPRAYGLLLLPGVDGFSAEDRADGPVVNLSYWVFEAFPVLAALDPSNDWKAVSQTGETLVATTQIGARGLPPEWLSLADVPKSAEEFAPEFGYNALRIPLYLMRAGLHDQKTLSRFLKATDLGGGYALSDLASGELVAVLEEPGYRAINALAGCILGRGSLPADLSDFEPTHYYPSTLHLLVLSYARKEMPQCL